MRQSEFNANLQLSKPAKVERVQCKRQGMNWIVWLCVFVMLFVVGVKVALSFFLA